MIALLVGKLLWRRLSYHRDGMIIRPVTLAMAGLLLLSLISSSKGQGLAISGIGAVNQSMGGASTAAPIDAAGALYWNPATIRALSSSEVSFGLGLVMPTEELQSSFTFPALAGADRGEPGASPLPHIAWVQSSNDSPWAFGIGMFAVGGFRSNYPASLTNPILFPPASGNNSVLPGIGGAGRVFAEAELLQIVPTIAYAVTDSVAVGFAPTLTTAKLTVDPLLLAIPDDADGDGFPSYPSGRGNRVLWGGGFQVGVYKIGEGNWNWGATFKSPQWFEPARFKTEDEIGRPRDVQFSFQYPTIVSIGTAYKGFERWVFALDGRYFDYGGAQGFKERGFGPFGQLNGLGWESIFALSCGSQLWMTERLHTRLGYSYNENPIRDEDTSLNIASPVITQHYLYTGFSYQFTPQSIFSLAYTHGFENSIDGPIQTPLGVVPGSLVRSIVSLDAVSAAMTIRY